MSTISKLPSNTMDPAYTNLAVVSGPDFGVLTLEGARIQVLDEYEIFTLCDSDKAFVVQLQIFPRLILFYSNHSKNTMNNIPLFIELKLILNILPLPYY